VVRHVEAGQQGRLAQVRVQGEEDLAQEGRLVDVGEEVGDEVARVGVARVGGVVRVGVARGRGGVVEDDDFVYGEDGEGAGDATGDDGLELCRREAVKCAVLAGQVGTGRALEA
jgi:hypothetical protein